MSQHSLLLPGAAPTQAPRGSGPRRDGESPRSASDDNRGSSTGTSSVFPRCWLYCNAHPSV